MFHFQLSNQLVSKFSFLILIFVFINSCTFEDEENPTVSEVYINGKTEGIILKVPNDTLFFEAKFKDDYNLGIFNLKIINSPDVPSGIYFPKVFMLDTTFKIGGEESYVYKKLKLDSTLVGSGVYKLEMTFQDQEGKQGTPVQLDFTVNNTAPFVQLNSPSSLKSEAFVNQEFAIKGLLRETDDELDSLSISLWKKMLDKGKISYSSKPVWQETKGKINNQRYEFDYKVTYSFPDTLELRVYTKDKTVYPNKTGKDMRITTEIIMKK
ncbi:MAG: hypothetical protein OHK0038_06070 [Flammeovirgaceae bacterium]